MSTKPTPGKFVTKTVVVPAIRVKMLDPETGLPDPTPATPLGKFVTKTVVVPAKRVKMLDPRPALRLTFVLVDQQMLEEAYQVAAETIVAVKELASAMGLELEYNEANASVVEGKLIVNITPVTDNIDNPMRLHEVIRAMQSPEWRERQPMNARPSPELIPAG
jgi:hypothetical protein